MPPTTTRRKSKAAPSRVEVELAHGRKVKFPGKVVFVSPLVRPAASTEFRRSEQSARRSGQWVLRPGLFATMTIHLK